MTEDEHAIRELVATWMQASRAGDTETVLSLMNEDVVFMVPGREPFGKEAFASSFAVMKGMAIDGTSDIVEVQVHGDIAFARAFIRMTMTPPGAAPIRREGYTLTIFRKQPEGRWLLARDANLLAATE